MKWIKAPDIEKEIQTLIRSLDFSHIDPQRIFCFRSFGSSSRALARIWSLPRIWQQALGEEPAYCIEILSEKFDKLNDNAKRKVLVHELLHIPRTFSGSLVAHRRIKGVKFEKRVEIMFRQLMSKF